MGHIKEPRGVDLIVGPSTLTEKDRKMISEIIANYKRTGKLPARSKPSNPHVTIRSKVQRETLRKKRFKS